MKTVVPAGHRPDIQGLRALAVSLVLVFHLWPWLLPGGYIGVDVFFVISGFLITSHLMREIRLTGKVKLGKFWARRARRLLPASLLVLLSSTILVLTVWPALGRLQELHNIGFASVFGVNWAFAYDAVDYLGGDSSGSIVQHYWSLSLEEQFYLVWPVLLLLVALAATKASRRMPSIGRSTRPYLVAISLVFAASLLYSIYETAHSQPVAYFITPTRMWELAAGGLIAFLPASKRFAPPELPVSAERALDRLVRAAHPVLSWVAWAAILACALLFDAATPFPGSIALIPVAATAYLLWQQPAGHRWSPQRLSEVKPVQWLGDISYPVYLWHWPLIAVFIALRHNTPGPLGAVALIVATLLLAWLTKRWVEDPLRFRVAPFSKPQVMLPVAAAGIAVALVAALVPSAAIRAEYQASYAQFEQLDPVDQSCLGALALVNNCENPFARTSTVDPAAAREDNYITRGIRDCPQRPNLSGDLEIDCVLSDPSDPQRNAVLIGDSFTAQIADSLGDAAERLGWRLHERTLTGCTGFLRETDGSDNDALRYCIDWANRNYQEVLDDQTVDTVIISARSLDANAWQEPVARERIAAFVDAGKLVVVVHSPPGFDLDPPVCVGETPGDDPCTQPDEGRNDWLAQAADGTGAELLELRALLCPEGVCHTVIGGTVAYLDQHHLTQSFAHTLSPWFERSLSELVAEHG
ncbi:MAG: acyltransferase [Candidatus Leucobacter sulfamidivorax]|nr:acyltransferase [Candidatus Leucobacter sulfamidivorax]